MGKAEAFEDGQESVRMKPLHAPVNPYDADEEPELYNAWETGAISAGLCEIYTNGILHRSER